MNTQKASRMKQAVRLISMLLLGTAQGSGTQTLASVEALVGQWSALRLTQAEEQRDWLEQKEHWLREIDLLKAEKAELQKQMDNASNTGKEIEQERLQVQRDAERLGAVFTELPPLLEQSENALRKWPKRLPPLLREELDPLFAPLKESSTDQSPGARLQRILGLYATIEKVQQDIHIGKELLSMPDGTRREVDVCYLGLARGFAVSTDNGWAAIGEPTTDGWSWTPRLEIAQQVRNAVNVYHRQRSAELINLPLTTKEVAQ